MARVTILSPVSRGAGDHQPGEVFDLPDAEAAALVEVGAAAPYTEAPQMPASSDDAAGGDAKAAAAGDPAAADAAPARPRGGRAAR